MAIEEKTYAMCNYSTSPLVVALRERSVVINGGRRDKPTVYPFTMSELQQIDSMSSAIRSGRLVPADDIKEYIYETLRIMNWQDILSDEQIEDIILHPTVEGLTSLVEIKNAFYFERVFAAYVGLKTVNAPIAANVARLIAGRYKELQDGKITTEFKVSSKDVNPLNNSSDKIDDRDKEIAELKRQLKEATDMMMALATEKKAGQSKEKSIQSESSKSTTTKANTVKKNVTTSKKNMGK